MFSYLRSFFSRPVLFRFHENKRTYLRVEKKGRELKIHLHRLFEKAPQPIFDAIVQFALRGNRKFLLPVRQMAHDYFSTTRVASRPLREQGAIYDLRAMYEQIKGQFFTPDYDAAIGWSDRSSKSRFRSMTFGTYNRHTHQIRINPLLDDPNVPSYFVEFIVYHEMLHAVCLPQMDRLGRRMIHTPEFKQKERLFPHFKAAKEWEKKSLHYFRRRHGRS